MTRTTSASGVAACRATSARTPGLRTPVGYPDYQSTGSARAAAHAGRPAAAADRDHRAAARRGPGDGGRRRPDPPARGRAAGAADHRPRPGARQRRPAGARHAGRGVAGQRRRALPARRGQLARRRSTPTSPAWAGASPTARAATSSRRSSPAPTRGATTTTPGGRRTSTSRCSGGRSPSAWSPRCTSRTTRCSSRTRSSTPIPEAARPAGDQPLRPATRPCPSGRWPSSGTSCCAGAEQTPFETDDDGDVGLMSRLQTTPSADRRPVPVDRARLGRRPVRRRPGHAGRDLAPRRRPRRQRRADRRRADRDLAGRPGRPLRPPRRPARRVGATAGFRGFGRSPDRRAASSRSARSSPAGCPTARAALQAPHVDVSVFARGLLDRVVTRIYFADEADANAEDAVLRSLPSDERARRR